MDLKRLADILLDKIKRDYPEDVSLVHVHGSYVYGETHEGSDLDIYFVPKTPRGYQLGCSFIVDGIGCDVWALSWERLERIAAHEEAIASIITEGQVLYYGTDDDMERFERLKRQALDTSRRSDYLYRARKTLDKAYKNGFLIQNALTLPEVRSYAIGLFYDLSFSLAQLNQTIIKRGRKLLKQEILAMTYVPEAFGELYDTVFLHDDVQVIKNACVKLLQNTEKLTTEVLQQANPPMKFAEAFEWWYEEMIQSYNKIYHACETGDIYTPLYASAEFTSELDDILGRVGMTPDLPDMVAAYDRKDLQKIAKAAHAHQAAFENLLIRNEVNPIRFAALEELEEYLMAK